MFIARSKQLRTYVRDACGDYNGSHFTTFDKLICDVEASLANFIGKSFRRKNHVGFARFKNDFYAQRHPHQDENALIVWKSIRTFIKGSIEAFQQPDHTLPRNYFVGEQLGKNRCQVPLHLRDSIYEIFLSYQKWIDENQLYDDCDHIMALLRGIEDAKKAHSSVYDEQIKKMRLYVE